MLGNAKRVFDGVVGLIVSYATLLWLWFSAQLYLNAVVLVLFSCVRVPVTRSTFALLL